jgi:ribosome biogenesis GTPase A
MVVIKFRFNDIYFQVLDARDPMGSRCREVEMAVLAASKRLILVSLTVQLTLTTIELNGKNSFKIFYKFEQLIPKQNSLQY